MSNSYRSPINKALREWIAAVTGIPIAPLPIGPPVSPKLDEAAIYGALGDYRAEELETIIAAPPALYPLRNPMLPQIKTEIYAIISVRPIRLESKGPLGAAVAFVEGIKAVASGELVHWEIPPSPVFKNLVLTTGDQVAERIFQRETSLIMFDGNWATAYPAPAAYTVTGGEFLALSTHASGWFWTSTLDTGVDKHPDVVTELDAGGQALARARGTAVAASELGDLLERRFYCFHPFATRIHVTNGFEYRFQNVGVVFLYLLTWIDAKEAAPAAMAYRNQCMVAHDWQKIVQAGPGLMDTVSKWHSVCARPGSFLIIPPGTPVIEYSSGSSVSTGGSFLPWAGCPFLKLSPIAPNSDVVTAMLASYSELPDHIQERPSATDVQALAAYMPQAPPPGKLSKEIHERALRTCAEFAM
ncbi:hypothetical protein FRB90_000232 [Tulasnella sp. 427]|nr:hypothetical protein FRB90_000232 [Tulasnella sp. 427]